MNQGNPGGCAKNALTAKQYDKKYLDNPQRCLTRARELPGYELVWAPALAMTPHGRVLDAGCGTGEIAEIIRTECSYLEYVMGYDFSRRAIDQAFSRSPHDLFESADALTFSYDYWEYETVMMLEVLEHVVHDMAVISRVPVGKTVVLSVPSFWTEGHVRWFATPGQALERYRDVLEIDEVVVTSQHAAQTDNSWTIMRGVRR